MVVTFGSLVKKRVVLLVICVLLLEFVVICCVAPVSSVSFVGADVDYNVWTLDLPTGGILSSGDLQRHFYNSWWYPGVSAFEGYDMFQTPQSGAGEKAFGSQYVRCELREILPGSGDKSGSWGTNANWGRLGYHKMVTVVKASCINVDPRGDYASRDFTCIGQVWGYSNGQAAMFELFYMNAKSGESSFRMRSADAKGDITYAPVYIPVGKDFTVTYECIRGTLTVWVESEAANVLKTKIYSGQLANPVDKDSYYFKTGNYDQSSDAKGDNTPDPMDVHTLIGFKSIRVEHNPIRGRLAYADGRPVANQVVDYVLNGGGVSNLRLSVVTDADGYYYIPNDPSNGGIATAKVSIDVPTLLGYVSDKKGVIEVAAADTSDILGVRSGNMYDVVYVSSNGSSPSVPAPNVSVDYVAEVLKGLNGVYVINGKTFNVSGICTIDSSWFGTTIAIIKKGDGLTSDSSVQHLFIKSRPPAPSISKTDCTLARNNNGAITKVTKSLEYSADNGSTWKTITGPSVNGLKPGTYYVRVKATSMTFKSAYSTVVINAYSASFTYKVQKGDSLWFIGLKFGVTVDAIKNANALKSNMIYPDQKLLIPYGTVDK